MLYICTTKKKITTALLVILLSAVLALSAALQYGGSASVKEQAPVGATRADRIKYFSSLGYSVDDTQPETEKQVEIPFVFSDVYEGYNALQKQAGFDLSGYGGKRPTLYTLKLNYEGRNDVYGSLLVLEEKIIGGDITARDVENGFIYPLKTS